MARIERRDGSGLRAVLSGMVSDPVVCSRIAAAWSHGGLFDSPAANLIGQWCVDHLRCYGTPPNGRIRSIAADWAEKVRPSDETVQSIEALIGSLREPSASDAPYLLDLATRYINRVRVRQAIEEAEEELDRGDVASAIGRLASVGRLDFVGSSCVKPEEDFEAWVEAFDQERHKQLIRYPGVLDAFLGTSMVRGGLVAFMGPDKSFKSYMLLDAAYRAARWRSRVAYFEVGDLSRAEVLLRLGCRAARLPKRKGVIRYPVSVDEDSGSVEWKELNLPAVDEVEAMQAFRRLCRHRGGLLRLSCHANSSISVQGICSTLRDWATSDGWRPDVVVIDYADILAPPTGHRDVLDQIDETWKQLRRLSQEHDCLVLTATQTSALAYQSDGTLLTKRHFGGRKTKLAHATAVIGLNVGPGDRARGIIRFNYIVRRAERYTESGCVAAVGCIELSNPVVLSFRPVNKKSEGGK